MSFCKNCGSVIVNTPVICQHCKNEITYIPGFCTSCRNIIDSRPAYCNFCGKEIRPALKEFAVEDIDLSKEIPVEVSDAKDNIPEETVASETPVSEPTPVRTVHIPVTDTCVHTPTVPLLPAETVGGYAYNPPAKKRDAGSIVSGIIGLVLSIIGLFYAIYMSLFCLASFEDEVMAFASLIMLAVLAPPSIIGIVLANKARQYGFNGGVSKAAKVTGTIGMYTFATEAFLMLMTLAS